MTRTALLALVLLLPACGGDGTAPTGRSLPTPVAPPATSGGARVDSALCDDLRAIVEVRRGAAAATTEVVDTAAQAAVAAASRRVLVAAGDSGVLPQPVLQALQEYESRAPAEPGRDAVLAGFAEEQCPR